MLFLSLVVVQLAIFAALIFFLKHILTRNIRTATSHLNELNQDYTQKMEEANKRLQEGEKYYDDAILRAKSDAEKQKVEILKDARAQEEVLVNEARKQSSDILAQATRAKELMLEELEERINTQGLQKAGEILATFLPLQITEDMHVKWVEESLSQGFADLSRMNFADGELKVKVTSAYPLSAAHKKVLNEKIKTALNREFSYEEVADQTLIAGLLVSVGSIVIDGSLKHKIKEVSRRAQRAS